MSEGASPVQKEGCGWSATEEFFFNIGLYHIHVYLSKSSRRQLSLLSGGYEGVTADWQVSADSPLPVSDY